jgi:hypothetical protein
MPFRRAGNQSAQLSFFRLPDPPEELFSPTLVISSESRLSITLGGVEGWLES